MAERQRSLNKLRVLMLAILLHEDAYRRLPADVRDAAGRPILSWRVAVLPYLNERDLYERFKLDEPWDSAHNRPLLARMPDAYRAGHEPPGATDTYYQGFAGPGAAFDPAAVRRGPDGRYVASLSIKGMRDHPTTTLALVEAGPAVPWSKPADVPFDAAGPVPAGPFADVLNVATLSGTAYPLRPAVDPLALRALVRTDDGGSRQRPLDTHLAPLLAVTPEDRAALAARIARTREVLRELDRRMGDHLELLAANQDKAAGDLTHAYWQMDELAQLLGQVTRANGQLREAAGLPADPPVPPDRK
jgi:hypothetical protein